MAVHQNQTLVPGTAIVTRFAPSPTGRLHLGHAYAALFAWRMARSTGGRFLVRIEDIDRQRCRPDFERAILDDLTWLGLDWDGPVRRQSDHFDDYRAALDRLDQLGVLYPCFCSRKAIADDIALAGHAPQGREGPLYPGTCRSLSPAQRAARIAERSPYALRLDMAAALRQTGPLAWFDRERGWQAVQADALGDVIIARRDVQASYHLAVTLDDHLQGVTLVTRGADLFAATHTHRVLQSLLALDTPEWSHHPLLMNDQGERLAKRDGAKSIAAFREEGRSPADVRALAGMPD